MLPARFFLFHFGHPSSNDVIMNMIISEKNQTGSEIAETHRFARFQLVII